MRRALPAILASAAGITWLLRAQGVIDAQAHQSAANLPTDAGTSPAAAGSSSGSGGTPSTTTAGSGAKTTVDGDTIQTQWGPVQVAAVIQGNTLDDVTVLQYPNERDRSVAINDQALPLLHEEAMQAQSAQIDGLSGATYTSYGYQQSLQSALDKAGFHR